MNKRKILFAVMLILAFNGFAQTKEIANGIVIEKDSRKIVRKHEQQLVIDYSASDFQLVIYDNPMKKNQIGNLQRKQEITIKQIIFLDEKETIDGITERWAKIEYTGITGWVFGGYLEIERGGPKFCTPEWDIEMTLGAGI